MASGRGVYPFRWRTSALVPVRQVCAVENLRGGYALPTLILIRGLPGVGKSALARRIGAALRVPVFDKDNMGDVLMPVLKDQTLTNTLSYDILWACIGTQLTMGLDAILDTPLRWAADCERTVAWAGELGADVARLRAECSNHELHMERLALRGPSVPEHRRWTRDEYARLFGAPDTIEHIADEFRVDTAGDLDAAVASCLMHLETGFGLPHPRIRGGLGTRNWGRGQEDPADWDPEYPRERDERR